MSTPHPTEEYHENNWEKTRSSHEKALKRKKEGKLSGKLDKASGARDVTKVYKKKFPNSLVKGVHDVMRKD